MIQMRCNLTRLNGVSYARQRWKSTLVIPVELISDTL